MATPSSGTNSNAQLTYRARELAQLLGCSEDYLTQHCEALGGMKHGKLAIFLRWKFDQFLYGPNGGPEAPVDVVLRLLPALTPEQLVDVASRCLNLVKQPAQIERSRSHR
jgi:hypothetical protein